MPVEDEGGVEVLLMVDPAASRPVWHVVEDVLQRRTRRWRLLDLAPDGDSGRLDYLLRLPRGVSAGELLAEVVSRGGADIDSATIEETRK